MSRKLKTILPETQVSFKSFRLDLVTFSDLEVVKFNLSHFNTMDEEKQFFKKQLFTCQRGSYGKKPYSRHD